MYACGPLKKPRYINERIEQELVEFKQEIEERFLKSELNKVFRFPRMKEDSDEEMLFRKKSEKFTE